MPDVADEVERALREYAAVNRGKRGRMFAYEVDALGDYYCIDDRNIPGLLSSAYLGVVTNEDKIYQNPSFTCFAQDAFTHAGGGNGRLP